MIKMAQKNFPHPNKISLIFACLSFSFSLVAIDRSKIAQLMDRYASIGCFNGAVLIAQKDKVIFKKGYGCANYELDVANSSNTKFHIGSVTKQFTAAAILLLQEQGKLSVQDSLAQYIPDYPRGSQITLHHLLSHCSGIFNYMQLFNSGQLDPRQPITLDALIAIIKEKPLNFEPGKEYEYSNSNYLLLSFIIEKVSGKSYSQFMQEAILQPLQMHDSCFDNHRTIIKNRASGYYHDFAHDNEVENVGYIDHASVGNGAGGLLSTVEDLFSWNRALYGNRLLKKESAALMTSSFTHYHNQFEEYDYGYGLCIGKLHGRNVFFHGGCIQGFVSANYYFPESEILIILLSNVINNPLFVIVPTLAAAIFDQPYRIPTKRKEVPLDDAALQRYVGSYRMADGATITIAKEGSKLVCLDDQYKEILHPTSPTHFFVKHTLVELTFDPSLRSLIYHLPRLEKTAVRI